MVSENDPRLLWVCSSLFKMNWLVSMNRSTQLTKHASVLESSFGPGLSIHFSWKQRHRLEANVTARLDTAPEFLLQSSNFTSARGCAPAVTSARSAALHDSDELLRHSKVYFKPVIQEILRRSFVTSHVCLLPALTWTLKHYMSTSLHSDTPYLKRQLYQAGV